MRGQRRQKRSKSAGDEGGDRWVKRAMESFAKRLKERAEKRAEESASLRAGMDIDHTDVVKEIGTVSAGDSDAKFDDALPKLCGEAAQVDEVDEEKHYPAIYGEALDQELFIKARRAEMETFRKHGVREKRPINECWESTGREVQSESSG